MDIYEFSSIISGIFFILLWIPYILKIVKEKNAKSQSATHLIFLYLGFICNCIYSSSFKVKYTFYTYIFDISCLTLILFYKFLKKEKVEKQEIKIENVELNEIKIDID